MSTSLSTSFNSVSALGPKRTISLVGSADCVVVFESATASNATKGGRLKDPSDPTKDLALFGPYAHSPAFEDAGTYYRYVVLQGTVTSCAVDGAPLPSAGPQGAVGGDWTVTTTQTANYAASAGEFVLCDPSGGAFAVTLPAAATAGAGKRVCVKNTTTSTTAITIARSGSDTIDGGTSATMNTSEACKVYVSDGVSAWYAQS
jgi:hypothetical protein